MRFSVVYERILLLWPSEITLVDGVKLDGETMVATPQTAPNRGQPWLFPALSAALDMVEEHIDHTTDTWGSLMGWTMFQVFHAHAVLQHGTGGTELQPGTIPPSVVEEQYFANLHSDEWAQDLSLYERS